MIEESVFRAKKKIGDAVAVKITCAWRCGMPFQLVIGKIANFAEAPRPIASLNLQPQYGIASYMCAVHDNVQHSIAIPVHETDFPSSGASTTMSSRPSPSKSFNRQ